MKQLLAFPSSGKPSSNKPISNRLPNYGFYGVQLEEASQVIVISGPIAAQVAGKKCDCIHLPVYVLLAIRADYSRRKRS
jgi:hypothetical protein